MQHGYKGLRDMIKLCPLPLVGLPQKLKNVAETYLPYDTGIEIECGYKENIYSSDFRKYLLRIPNIKEVDCDQSEQRFRIPNGIKGMICLWNISEILKDKALLNPKSGIHYHIDLSDISTEQFNVLKEIHCNNPNSFILKSLKSWKYTGNYNTWNVSTIKHAVRFHSQYKTLEIRIGEMTFDYELLIKRILHCQNIVRSLKASLKSPK